MSAQSTRQTQPYRRSTGRAPGPVLDRMLAGRATPTPGAGKALAGMMRKGASRTAKRGVLVPYG